VKKSAQSHKKNKQKTTSKAVRRWIVPAVTAFLVLTAIAVTVFTKTPEPSNTNNSATESAEVQIVNPDNISLPKPDTRSNTSLETALNTRRSRREFLNQNLSLKQVSQMLWAAQGVTSDWGGRTTPSAKSTYPLTVYLIANKVDGLDPGEYQYIPGDRGPVHALKPIKKVELQKPIYELLNQNSFQNAPAVLLITGNMGKMAEASGGTPNNTAVYLEVGHAAQNLYLQAESLKLGMVAVASFNEARVRQLVTLPENETLIYMLPFGVPKL